MSSSFRLLLRAFSACIRDSSSCMRLASLSVRVCNSTQQVTGCDHLTPQIGSLSHLSHANLSDVITD